MGLILILIVEVFLASITKNIIDYNITQYIFLAINILLVGIYIGMKTCNKKVFYIIYIGFIIRIILMFIDIEIMQLPFSGGDTWSFHNAGLKIADALPETLLESPYGVYAQFVGIIYYLFGGPVKVFAQHINIVVFIAAVIKILDIFKLYDISDIWIEKALLLYVIIMPSSLFQSSILLREVFIIFLLASSTCEMLKWIKDNHLIHIFISYVYVFLAATLHSGVLSIGIAYAIIFAIYMPQSKEFKITAKSLIVLLLVFIVAIIGFKMFGEEFVHLNSISSIDSIIDMVNRSEIAQQSGSGYLKNVEIIGVIGLIIIIPIKLVYFLFSPMPWQVRGGIDLMTILLDSSFYFIAFKSFIQMKKEKGKIPKNIYNIVKILFITYIIMSIPFSLGTFAAGTAIRHRFKGSYIILISYTIYKNYKESKSEDNIIKETK